MTTTAWAAAVPLLLAAVLLGLCVTTWIVGRRIDAAYPPTGRFIDLPSGRLHYLDVGSGPPVVLIHGLGGSLGNFSRALLDALSGDFRMLVIDRPGSGHSPRVADAEARLPRQAALVAEFIAALELGRPLLVGHSLGGAIALAVALDHPGRVAGLALLAPLTLPDADLPPTIRRLIGLPPPVRRLLAWTVAVPLALWGRDTNLRAIFAPDAPPADFGGAGGGWLSSRPGAIYAASADLVAVGADLPALAARYGELTMPVGMLFGTADRVLDHRRQGVAMATRVPQLDLELVAGRGHMLPVSDAERCAGFIRRIAARAFAPPGCDGPDAGPTTDR